MKTASLPSLRVDPALREAAKSVLHDGETLSCFVEQSVRAQVQLRQQQEAFVARGLASRERARETGRHAEASAVLAALEARLTAARTKASKAPSA